MNLISLMITASIGLIVAVSVGQMMINQAKMSVHIEYLNDTQTARNSIELRADCKKSHLPSCTVRNGTNTEIVSYATPWIVGRANVGVVCDADGFNVYATKQNGSSLVALVPLKICGGGTKVCNLTRNSDGISCAGGSKSY